MRPGLCFGEVVRLAARTASTRLDTVMREEKQDGGKSLRAQLAQA